MKRDLWLGHFLNLELLFETAVLKCTNIMTMQGNVLCHERCYERFIYEHRGQRCMVTNK
jgi:hypothetical protein